jgi:membrane protein implicated in regulation of membrane protease activity
LDASISPILLWTILGVVLIILEISMFSFVLCFFGVGAMLVAFTTWIHLTPGTISQCSAFVVFSILMMFVLRKTARKLFAGTKDKKPEYIGQKVKIVKTIKPGEEGIVSYRGSDWIAFGDAGETYQAGEQVEILDRDGIRFRVGQTLTLKTRSGTWIRE